MTIFVTKASDEYWYEIRVFNTMEDIQRFIKKCGCKIIVGRNIYTAGGDFKFWCGMKAEDIPVISKCPLHITIYDDYVE